MTTSKMSPQADDIVMPFRVERGDASGRLVRLGPAMDEILTRHAYPDKVSEILGQSLLLVAMFGSMIKDRQRTEKPLKKTERHQRSKERFILQTQSDGPLNLIVADFVHPGHLRAYARFDKDRLNELENDAFAGEVLGRGHLAMTIDRGDDTDRTQGIVALKHEGSQQGLIGAANRYFEQSEQLPTYIHLAMARHFDATLEQSDIASDGWHWRGGALMVQKLTSVGGHEAQTPLDQAAFGKEEEDSWNRALLFSKSVKDHELLDPLLSSPDLLFRLYHEDGVRVFEAKTLQAACSCSLAGVTKMLEGFSKADQQDMVESDGKVHITCEFCNRAYELTPNYRQAE